MAESELKQKTAKGLFWSGFGNALSQVFMLFYGIILGRYFLTPDEWGIYGKLAIISALGGILINSGFFAALINKQDAGHKDYNAVFWFGFLMSLLLYVMLFFGAPLIAAFYDNQTELINLSRLTFLSLPFVGVYMVPQVIMTKALKVKQIAIIDTLSLFLSSVIGFFFAWKGASYWALAAQAVTYSFINMLLKFWVAGWKPTLSFDFSPLKSMFSFSFKLLLTYIFQVINQNIFSVILGKWFTNRDTGNYIRGSEWANKGYSFISGMINSVSQPILSQINDEKERQVRALRKMIRFGAFVSFPLLLGFGFVGREFILVALREEWLGAVPFLQLFCLWYSVMFLYMLYINLFFSHGKSNLYMNVTVATGLMQFAAILALYRYGIMVMVGGYVAVAFLGLFIAQYYVTQLINLRLRDVLRDVLPYLGITLLCFAIAWLCTRTIENPYLLLAAKILISGGLYVLAMKISRSVIFEESVGFLRGKVSEL